MAISESEQYNRVDQLAEEFAARFRRGERPALEEYTDRYPELAQEIRELFPAMVQVEQAEVGRQVEEEKETGDSRTANSPLAQIGDYRILREIGRGGMGVVYEAEQISLGRRVALKVLPKQASGNRLVQERFRREARAAARLHHTNIVPVFEVGQDEDVRFYAMQFIQGQGLDRVITELQQLRDRVGSEHKTKAASLGQLLRPRRHGERSRQDIVAPTIAAGADVSEVLQSILIGRFEPGSRASEQEEENSPSMLGSTRNGNLATATAILAKHRATKPDVAVADTRTECMTAGEIDELDGQAEFRMGVPQGEPDANGSGTRPRPPGTTKSHLLGSSPLSPSSSSAVLPGGSQLSSVDSGRLGFFRSLAQIGRQVAGGLAYAHARGIVHRDIKPANLLLDTEGVVWIADFGLAKAEDEGLTQSGDILGTIRYMAPERFRGEGDARADVYSLGMTLYELLTLRPGFDCSDRLKLIEQIKGEEPKQPRAIDARIPRDLETIVLKAIEKDPKTRYASAEALGEDLRRFLADEPIRARRATLTEQTVRWCRRNPAVASLVAAVLLATLAGTGVASFYAVRAENERGNAVDRENEAIRSRKNAETASVRASIARRAAEDSAEEARKRLTRLYVFSGVRYQDDRDTPAALLWFHRAWEQDHADPMADAAHRSRIAGALAEMPDLIGACFHKTKVCDALFSPDGRRVLARTDGNEAYLWDYENSRLAAPALSHAGRVRHIAYSPDGKSVATASADGTACVWDSANGARRFTLKHDGPLTWVAFYPDGKRIATAAEDRTVRMWSAIDGKPIAWRLPVDTVIEHLAFSPDGSRLLTAGRDKLVRVWDVDPPKAISPTLSYRQPTDTERYAFNQDSWPKFAPDGRAVLSSDGKGLEVWAGGEKDPVRKIPFGSRYWVVETYFVPGTDRVLVTGNSHVATVVELEHGKVVHELSHPREANLGAVSPDGKWLLTCSSGGMVSLWDAATGLRAGPPQRCGDFCSAVVFTADSSRYLAASQDGTVRVWTTGPRTPPSHSYRYDCGRANLLVEVMKDQTTFRSYSPDGRRRVEWTQDGKASYHSGPDVAPQPISHPGPVEDARFCDDGSRLIVSGGRAIQLWDPDTVSPAGPVVSAATLVDPLWRWNTRISSSPPVAAAIPADPRENTRVTPGLLRPDHLSRDGTRIVCLDDERTLSVWDLTASRRVFGPARHPDPGPQVFEQPSRARWVSDAVLSPDGRLLAVGIESTGTLTVWDVDTGAIVHHNRRFRGYLRKVQFSNDGRRVLLASSDGQARMYDSDTGIPLGPAVSQPGGQLAIGVSPDGRRLSVYDDHLNGFRTFDVERGERLLTIPYVNRTKPTALWFDAAGRSLNAAVGAEVLTFPLPRFDVPFDDSKALMRFLTGQQIDPTEGVEFVDQSTFRKDPDHYRDVFLAWKSRPVDGR